MAHLATPTEVVALLDGEHEEELVGMEETDWLDFKGAPYRLGERREQWELAKDVAALANAAGGIIVVGVHTARLTGRDEEIATEVAAFPASMFDPKQARDVVAAQVYRTNRDRRPDIRPSGREAARGDRCPAAGPRSATFPAHPGVRR